MRGEDGAYAAAVVVDDATSGWRRLNHLRLANGCCRSRSMRTTSCPYMCRVSAAAVVVVVVVVAAVGAVDWMLLEVGDGIGVVAVAA